MNARRAAIGFQGGQVLSLRITEEKLSELRAALADGSLGGWREVEATDRANALDLAIYKRVRRVARTPETVRWVRSYSRLGEHGAVWLATGAAGVLLDAGQRRRWARATVCVGGAYMLSTSIKLAVGRRRPVIEDL